MNITKLGAVDKFIELGKLESHKYKSLAYTKAATEIDQLTDDEFNSLNNFTHLPNIGIIINNKIMEYKTTGEICKLIKLQNN